MDDRDEQLLEAIVEYLNEPAVRPKVKKAIEDHGYDAVNEEFGEMRAQILSRSGTDNPIKNPPGYLLKLLQELGVRRPNESKPKDKSVFFNTLVEHLDSTIPAPVSANDLIEYDGVMTAPYSSQGIPWPTALGPEFFTLSTNKKTSDEVLTAIRLSNGQRFLVPMVRGKALAKTEERGILTAEDNRIIKAMVIIWAEDGCQHTTGKIQQCFSKFTVRRLARTMGYTNFGGRDQDRLTQRLERIGIISYYIDLTGVPGFEAFDKKIYSIDFIDKPQFVDMTVKGHREITVFVKFSQFLTRMFIARKTVTRSKDLVLQRNEIALLVQEYIEARVRENESDKDGFRVALSTLIQRLHLPVAKWHKVRSHRVKNFKRAVEEVNGSTTWDGDAFFASIDENISGPDALLRVKRTKIIDAPELPFTDNTYGTKTKKYLAVRERAQRAYIGKFQLAAIGELALVLRQFVALRIATDPK